MNAYQRKEPEAEYNIVNAIKELDEKIERWVRHFIEEIDQREHRNEQDT